MMSFFVQRKTMRCLAALLVFLYTIDVAAVAQVGDESVSNVRISKQGRVNVFIEYDLAGSVNELYTVTLTVKLKSDSAYSYSPVNVIGDIGANIRPGTNKRISWRMSDEYTPAFDSDDVQFVVNANPVETGSTNSELYIAGGAVVVGLALAIVLLSSSKTDDGQKTNTFPQPPGRPR